MRVIKCVFQSKNIFFRISCQTKCVDENISSSRFPLKNYYYLRFIFVKRLDILLTLVFIRSLIFTDKNREQADYWFFLKTKIRKK